LEVCGEFISKAEIKKEKSNMEQFVDLLDAPYSRRGSYFAFANDNLRAENVLGMSNLWLCNCRSVNYAMTDLTRPNNYRQVLLQPVKDGRLLPAFLNTTPEEVAVETAAGAIRFCIAERRCVLAHSSDGLTLRISPRPDWMGGQISVQVGESHDVEFGTGRLRITPLRGTLHRCPGGLELAPDDAGVAEAAFEDYLAEHRTYREAASAAGAEAEVRQTNHEGVLVDWIQQARGVFDAIVLNAAAYTHTSVAILDAIKAVRIPVAEVHLTEPKEREPFRRVSYVGMAAEAVFSGRGFDSYADAIRHFAAKGA
jgi:3-dehydroquinate dehydratase-2